MEPEEGKLISKSYRVLRSPKYTKIHIVPFAGFMKHIPRRSSKPGKVVPTGFATSRLPAISPKRSLEPQLESTLRVQPIQIFQPKTHKQSVELREFRVMQKNMNKDFSFSEKNTKVAPKTSNRERHRLEDVPGNFILAVISGRFKQMENYLSGFCATVVERRILVNAEDEYCRSPIFYAVFTGLFLYIH